MALVLLAVLPGASARAQPSVLASDPAKPVLYGVVRFKDEPQRTYLIGAHLGERPEDLSLWIDAQKVPADRLTPVNPNCLAVDGFAWPPEGAKPDLMALILVTRGQRLAHTLVGAPPWYDSREALLDTVPSPMAFMVLAAFPGLEPMLSAGSWSPSLESYGEAPSIGRLSPLSIRGALGAPASGGAAPKSASSPAAASSAAASSPAAASSAAASSPAAASSAAASSPAVASSAAASSPAVASSAAASSAGVNSRARRKLDLSPEPYLAAAAAATASSSSSSSAAGRTPSNREQSDAATDNPSPGVDRESPATDNPSPGVDRESPATDNPSPGVDRESPATDLNQQPFLQLAKRVEEAQAGFLLGPWLLPTQGPPLTIYGHRVRYLNAMQRGILEGWFQAHEAKPFPTREAMANLCRRTGLPFKRVQNWFINTRKRFYYVAPGDTRPRLQPTRQSPAAPAMEKQR